MRLPTRRIPNTVASIIMLRHAGPPWSPVIVPGSIACISVVQTSSMNPTLAPASSTGVRPKPTTMIETTTTAASAISR